ncbi:MAG: norM, partial [Deltaproteobacteria bacterium]|nr:norM [Deltaproteobacteria bacterium]
NGLTNATAARVGHFIGQEEPHLARRSGQIAIATGAMAMMAFGAIVAGFASEIAGGLSTDPLVQDVSTTLLWIVGLSCIFDGIQLVSAGALRGTGDTRTNLYTGLIGYWVVGLPLGYLLGSVFGWGVAGYWIGHTVGLGCVAVLLVVRFWKTSVSLERLEKTHHSVVASGP